MYLENAGLHYMDFFFCIIIPHKRSGSLFTAQNLEKVLVLSNHQKGSFEFNEVDFLIFYL